MVSLSDVPEVIYTNEQLVDRLFSYLNEGEIMEVVHRSLDSEAKDKGGGLNKIIKLRYGSTSTDEEETERIRKLDSVGKFAILHGLLEDEEDIINLNEISDSSRQKLDDGDFVQAKGKITSSPVNELQKMIEEARPYFDLFGMDEEVAEEGEEISSMGDIQTFLKEMDTGEDVYRVKPSKSSSSGELIFPLEEENIEDQLSKYTEYYVLGRVEHIYEEDEEEWLINIMDLMPKNDRESMHERRMFLKHMSEASSELLGRKVDESDFKIGHSDIRVRPMAIYLY